MAVMYLWLIFMHTLHFGRKDTKKKITYTRVYVTFLRILALFCAKGVIFLPKITDCYRDEGDHHLRWRRVPTPYFHAQFETEIVDRQIDTHDEDISAQLPPAVELRGGEGDVFLQPETGQQRDRKDDAQRRDMRRDRLRELITEY